MRLPSGLMSILTTAVCVVGAVGEAGAKCPLPYVLTNGQTADAAQVMANFNALLACITPGGTSNSIMYNSGSGLAGLGPLTDGQTIVGSTGNPPQAQTLSAGAGISITNGPGSITIARTTVPGTGLFRQVISATPTSGSTGLTAWLNQGGAVSADSAVGISVDAPPSSTANVTGKYMAAPSAPYTITVLLAATRNSGVTSAGIGWYDGTAKLQVLSYESNGIYGARLRVRSYNSPTTSPAYVFTSASNYFSEPIWFRIQDDGANISFAFSQDGVNFIVVYSVAKFSGFLGASGYSNILFFLDPGSSAHELATLMSWTQTAP